MNNLHLEDFVECRRRVVAASASVAKKLWRISSHQVLGTWHSTARVQAAKDSKSRGLVTYLEQLQPVSEDRSIGSDGMSDVRCAPQPSYAHTAATNLS
eukprot:765272-Hanusia_phi.AAC.1